MRDVADGDLPLAGQPAVAAHQVDPGSVEPLDLPVVLPVVREGVAPLEHLGGLEPCPG